MALFQDLKADNILVEMTGVCKISDFGISKRTDDSAGGAFTAMQGTVFWMAPEVINLKKKGYNFKIDIWSVGCVVLEMWAGMRPWMGDEAVAVMFKVHTWGGYTFCMAKTNLFFSCFNQNYHHQCRRMLFCPHWLMTSDESALLCGWCLFPDVHLLTCFKSSNPEERPTATELRKHPYLILPLDWGFTDFK